MDVEAIEVRLRTALPVRKVIGGRLTWDEEVEEGVGLDGDWSKRY